MAQRDWRIEYRADAALSDSENARLRHFLFGCFPYETAFLTRRYIKQAPAHRWLVLDEKGGIVGHAAVHEKTIGTQNGDLRIGGVAEVCVASPYRGKGVMKELLREIFEWLHGRDVPFAMLFGQPKVYASSGFQPIDNELAAENSLARHWNPFCGKAMIKPLAKTPWPRGKIELRGPTF